jgi:hypothetical protein
MVATKMMMMMMEMESAEGFGNRAALMKNGQTGRMRRWLPR